MTYSEWLKLHSGAAYFACNDPEQLSHGSPEEAVIDYVEGWWGGEGDFKEFWEREGIAVTVKAYERMVITPQDKQNWAEAAFDHIRDAASDEYGYPDGDWGPTWGEWKERMVVLVGEMFEKHKPWGCEDVSSYELTKDEVYALIQEHEPDWLEKKGHP